MSSWREKLEPKTIRGGGAYATCAGGEGGAWAPRAGGEAGLRQLLVGGQQ